MRVAVLGCGGRMGRVVVGCLLDQSGLEVVAGVQPPGDGSLGIDLGVLAGRAPLGVAVSDDTDQALAVADAAIDFTIPTTAARHAALAANAGTALVIGTTGLDETALRAVRTAATRVPIVMAANMSRGVTLLQVLVERVARALDASFDVEVVELHHRRKLDAPSGTALSLAAAAAHGRGVRLEDVAERGRDGITGPREAGRIGLAALRGGDAVGEHVVMFLGPGERLELTHRATDRTIFGRGAVQAALWTQGRPPGLYDMRDVLGVSD